MKPEKAITLSEAIYARFADYYRRNPAWGVFHVSLADGNYELGSGIAFFDASKVTDEERDLSAIFEKLSYSQRKKLAAKAAEIVRCTEAAV
ncbi:MAG TPA: hypothetical protein VIL74_08940 [Pyrinomonadaceae bacterium]|jgi:hypothetical protein